MADDLEMSGMMQMGVAAALSTQYAQEGKEFLPMVATMLKQMVPAEVQVIETGFFKKTLKGVVLGAGENELRLEEIGSGRLKASFTRVVRGIALKTEAISVQEWVALVGDYLESRMKENMEIRRELAKVLGLS